MPANKEPIFTVTPNLGRCELAAANTAADGSGVLVLLGTIGANGGLFPRVIFQSAQATPAASALKTGRIYVTDTAGANPFLRGEVLIPAITRSATVIGPVGTFTFPDGLIPKFGMNIYVSQSVYGGVADKTHVWLEGGDY